MRAFASLACSALALLGGCILVYDPGSFEVARGGAGGSQGADGGAGGTGSAGGAGTGGGNSGDGGGPACSTQDPIDGGAVAASPKTWTWITVSGTKCRDGSSAGFGIRLNAASTKLFIFFQAEGACFNALSCSTVPKSFGSNDFDNVVSLGTHKGIFDVGNPANPLDDWNAVFIPDCTGDTHAGSTTGVVPGATPSSNSFTGFSNVGHFMGLIVPTFPNITRVLVAGSSAGASGALFNYDRIARDFCNVPVDLLIDSGPPMSDKYEAPCLQKVWRDLWGVNFILPKDCPEASSQMDGGGVINLITCLGKKYQGAHLGVIASTQDNSVATFLGFGRNNCLDIDKPPVPLSTYTEGLLDLRDNYMSQSPAWGSYFVNSTTHSYLIDDSLYNTTVNNVDLHKWVKDMVTGGPIANLGP